MSIKKILKDFTHSEAEWQQQRQADSRKVSEKIEALLIKLNKCFVETILPAVFETEEDLRQAGFWTQLNIGQSKSLASGKPSIKDVTLHFFPEKSDPPILSRKRLDTVPKAVFRVSGNLRKITFSIHFPKRLPPVVEIEDATHSVEDVNPDRVDAFLEKFIRGAIDVHISDRVLR